MNAPHHSPLPPRPSFLTSLIMLEERIRRDRIIIDCREEACIPAAHVVDAMNRRDR